MFDKFDRPTINKFQLVTGRLHTLSATKGFNMTTHRYIQICNLLDTARAKARSCRICACNLARIGNSNGASLYVQKAQRFDRIALACCDRIEQDEIERAPKNTVWAHSRVR